jgi:LacI family transcriptional regulator
MKPTLQQIADLAGVSRGTVDRALHNRGRIDPSVAERIIEIAESLNYISPRKAKKDPGSKIRIGFVTFLSERVFSGEINKGIEQAKEELSQWGIEILVEKCVSINDIDQSNAIDKLLEKDIKGLAIMPVDSELIRSKLNYLSDKLGIPVVTFNTDIVGTRRTCFIGMDNKKSGRVAAGLMGMITQGTGSILIITGSFANNSYSLRVDGFIEELKTSFPSIKIAGVQCAFDNMNELEVILENTFLNSSGISGILVTSSGQDGVETAFKKLNLKKRPFVIFYDMTPCTTKALQDNIADFVIEQDCFSQGYNAAYALANMLVKKQYPAQEYLYTNIDIKTKYNI